MKPRSPAMRNAERAVAAAVLGGCTLLHPGLPEVLAACASFLGFCYMQAAHLFAEKQAFEKPRNAKTARKLSRIVFARETLWILLFLVTGNYPGIAGCLLFVVYPFWRKELLRRALALQVGAAFDFGDEVSITMSHGLARNRVA